VMLLSDQGLIRFDVAAEKFARIDLPGDAPHAAVIPEWAPYDRRDPRFVYCARLPEEGGAVFRYHTADGESKRWSWSTRRCRRGIMRCGRDPRSAR
jgi:hypothetical protein